MADREKVCERCGTTFTPTIGAAGRFCSRTCYEWKRNDPLLKLSEVAALTGTPLETVRRWVREKRIPVERIGPLVLKRVRVRQSTVYQLFPHAREISQS